VNYMLAKDSVKSRMGGERGISFTEFSYMTMQAYDFLHLYRERGCLLQCGGNDQWGNIVAGIDLIRKVEGAEAYGLTFPLVTTASGEKFGKSAGNAVWLDADRTPVFDFYQYWMRVDDRDAGRYLRYFTFLEPGEIEAIEAGMRERPEERPVQRRLAHEATALVHGEEAAERAERETEIMYGRSRSVSGSRSRSRTGSTADSASGPRVCSTSELSDATLAVVPMAELDEGLSLPRLMREVGLADSSSAASAVIKGGGAYVNGERVTDPKRIITRDDLGPGGLLELRAGRKRRMVVKFE
jgi:tyrosyl-tRNA synthetase